MSILNDLITGANNLVHGSPAGPTTTKNGAATMDTILAGQPGDGLYSVLKKNWYTAKPYGFTFNPRGNSSAITMYLPISPSNIAVQTQFATNIITTLYGTVEEHSEVRYYDISISGTTGMAPKYVYPLQGAATPNPPVISPLLGRASFPMVGSLDLGGFFAKTLSLVTQIVDKATDLAGMQTPINTAIYIDQSGYLAFHNLYRFLLVYKRDVAGQSSIADRNQHPLTFFNYKDNVMYDVVIRSFNVVKDSENPQLYNYSINMRGYNLRTAGTNPTNSTSDQQLAALGLAGVKNGSFLGDIKVATDSAKQIVGAALGGVNVIGR